MVWKRIDQGPECVDGYGFRSRHHFCNEPVPVMFTSKLISAPFPSTHQSFGKYPVPVYVPVNKFSKLTRSRTRLRIRTCILVCKLPYQLKHSLTCLLTSLLPKPAWAICAYYHVSTQLQHVFYPYVMRELYKYVKLLETKVRQWSTYSSIWFWKYVQ